MSDARERRRHYRLRYPEDLRPTVVISGVQRSLTEVSVRGVRFVTPPLGYAEGQIVRVELNLMAQAPLVSEAVVLRTERDEVILWLTEEIDHAVILREQRRLIRRARMDNNPDTLNLLRTWPPPPRLS